MKVPVWHPAPCSTVGCSCLRHRRIRMAAVSIHSSKHHKLGRQRAGHLVEKAFTLTRTLLQTVSTGRTQQISPATAAEQSIVAVEEPLVVTGHSSANGYGLDVVVVVRVVVVAIEQLTVLQMIVDVAPSSWAHSAPDSRAV